MAEEQKWLIRAKLTYQFHRARIIEDDDWNITATAKALRRSVGGVSEDIMIVKWLKMYKEQIEKFEYGYQALEFIRREQKKRNTAEIE